MNRQHAHYEPEDAGWVSVDDFRALAAIVERRADPARPDRGTSKVFGPLMRRLKERAAA